MSLTTLPVTTPVTAILVVINREGGVIRSDFVSSDKADAIVAELEPYNQSKARKPPPGTDGNLAPEMGEVFLASVSINSFLFVSAPFFAS